MHRPLVAAWIAFVVAVVGLSGAHAWLDAGELGAAGFELGVMHPPGMPGLAPVMHLLALIPIGGIGFRLAMASAVGAAATVGLTVAWLDGRGTHPWVMWGAAGWLMGGMTWLRHARGVEIYMPQLAALALVLWSFERSTRPQRGLPNALVGTFVATWAIWSFAELRLLLPPLLLLMWLKAVWRRDPYALWAPLVVVWASACVALLPLASARGPLADWGNPQTWSAMVEHVLASSIRTAYAHDMMPRSAALWWSNLRAAVGRLSEDMGLIGPAAVMLALGAAWLRPQKPRERRAVAVLTYLCLGSLLYAVGINPMGGIDRQTGLVLVFVSVLLVTLEVDALVRPRPRLRLALVPVLGVLTIAPAVLASARDPVDQASWAPHAWTRQALAQLPPGALLLTQSDDLSAGVLWARVVEGARPDVASWPGQHLHRGPGDRLDARAQKLWRAIDRQHTDDARITAAISAWPYAVALENAGAGVFARIPFAGTVQHLPLSLAGLGVQPGPTMSVADEARLWDRTMTCAEDRHKLAMAVAEWARGWVRGGGDVTLAIDALQLSLSQLNPRHASAMVTLGSLYDRLGQPDQAIAWTRRSLEIEPDRSAGLLNLALYLSRDASRLAEARQLAERAVQLRPWEPAGWLRLADIRVAVGDMAGAGQAQAKARELVAGAQRGQ